MRRVRLPRPDGAFYAFFADDGWGEEVGHSNADQGLALAMKAYDTN